MLMNEFKQYKYVCSQKILLTYHNYRDNLDILFIIFFFELTWWVADLPDVASPPITTKLHAPHPNYQTTIQR